MRVLQILHGFSMGGTEALVKDYLLYLKKRGIECAAVCFDVWCGSRFEQELLNAGIEIVNVRDRMPKCLQKYGLIGRAIIYINKYYEIKKVIHTWKPDIIHNHLHTNKFIYFALGKKPLFGQSGKRTVLFHTVHNEPTILWPPMRDERRSFMRTADFLATKKLVKYQQMHFIALHERMRKEVNQLFHVDDTVVLNNGIDFKKYENLRSSNEVRALLHIPENAFLVGHVGRMADQKNHEKVISVFKMVRTLKPNAHLLLVGDGPLEAEVRKKIVEEELQNCTTILSNRGDIPDLMNAMNVFLFPSKFEGLGIVLIEAQKVKLPCVISDAVPEHAVISNYVRVIKLTDDDSVWVDAVTTPFPDAISYTNLDDWNMEHVVEKLLALYREKLNQR